MTFNYLWQRFCLWGEILAGLLGDGPEAVGGASPPRRDVLRCVLAVNSGRTSKREEGRFSKVQIHNVPLDGDWEWVAEVFASVLLI